MFDTFDGGTRPQAPRDPFGPLTTGSLRLALATVLLAAFALAAMYTEALLPPW
jgi:hypothetical protein